jgi:putative DNA-invertase from lambdoid prophage Rac
MAIWGYVRGDSIAWLWSKIEAYASERGMKIKGIVVEQQGVRGYRPIAGRPVAGPLFAKLVRGDSVIVAKFDSLFRSRGAPEVIADLKRRGVGLHILELGGDMACDGWEQLMTITAAFAAGERYMGDRVGEAIRQRKHDDKANGRYTGGKAPFGFRRGDDGKLMKNKGEQEAIREIIAMKARGKSLRSIVVALAAQGHELSHAGVAGILRAVLKADPDAVTRYMNKTARSTGRHPLTMTSSSRKKATTLN